METSRPFLCEDWKEKVIFDQPSATDSISVSEEGCVAVISAHTLHLLLPRFESTAFYQQAWMETLDTPRAQTNERSDFLGPREWLESLGEVRLCVAAHRWLARLWSAALLSDGSVVLLKFSPFFSSQSYELPRKGSVLRLRGLEATALPSSSSSSCYRMDAGPVNESNETILGTAIRDDSGIQLCCYRVVTHPLSQEMEEVEEVGTFSNSAAHGDSISLVKVSALDKGHCSLYLSTALGQIWVVDMWLQSSSSSSSSSSPRLRANFSLTNILTVGLEGLPRQIALVDEQVVLVTSRGLGQLLGSSVEVKAEVGGLSLCRLLSVEEEEEGADKQVLDVLVADESRVRRLRVGAVVEAVAVAVPPLKDGCELLSLATDPLGVLVLFTQRLPPTLSSSREVQLHGSLARPRLAVRAMAAPNLPNGWLARPAEAARVIRAMVQQRRDYPHRSASFLALLLLDAIEDIATQFCASPPPPMPQAILDFARGLYEDPVPLGDEKDQMTDGEEGAEEEEKDEDDDVVPSDSDSEKEANSSSLLRFPAVAGKGAKSANAGKAKGEEGSRFGLARAFEAIRSHIPPDPVALSRIGIDLFVRGCVAAISPGDRGHPLPETEEEEVYALLAFPHDLAALQHRLALWQLCSLGVRSVRQVRHTLLSEEFLEHLAALRGRQMVLQTFLSASRLVDALQQGEIFQEEVLSRVLHYHQEVLQIARERQYPLPGLNALLTFLRRRATEKSATAESCPICSLPVAFDPLNPEASLCSRCDVVLERCAFSFLLVTTAEQHDEHHHEVFRCPVCPSAINLCWARRCSRMYEVVSGQRKGLLCPFCAVPFHRVN
eukprot:gene8575-9448_t